VPGADAVSAAELLAEIHLLWVAYRARPDFGYSKTPSPATQALEDQIRTLSDRYTRLTAPPTNDHEDARVVDSPYQAASP